MADVLITHSYHLPYDPKQLRKMQPYLPLGMLYAASALRQSGISVAAFDSMLEDPSRSLPALFARHRPRIVVVYEDDFNFLSKMCLTRMRDVAREIATLARTIGAHTIAHGSDSTDNPALFLESGFDHVLCGEAEETLTLLCNSILRGERNPAIDGLVTLTPDGRLIGNGQRLASNPGWSELPSPARDLVNMDSYREAWVKAHGYFSTNMVSSRGCPYHCNWCAKPISGNKFHLRPAAAVAEEMKQLKAAGVQHIWFGDDVFALDHHWVREFAAEVTSRDAVLPFKIQSRANLMTRETVHDLKTAGCSEVWMGVESGSQAILDAMDKGLDLQSIIAARHRLKAAGIRACYFLQFGYPGETWAELQQTIALVRQTRPDDIGVSFSYPLPGTLFYERVRAQLGEKRNWTDSDDLCIMFRAAYTTDFYRAVRDALHAEVSSWYQLSPSSSQVNTLWHTVEDLEPVSRVADAFVFGEETYPATAAPMVTVEQLLHSGGTA